MEKIKIKNSLGGSIAAVIHYTKTDSNRLAVLCPGNLDSKDYDHLVLLAVALAEHGYTVVRFDPTGTWESDGDISEYSITQYLKDIKSVLDYMLEREAYIDILLGGHSRGGQLSILYAARDPRIALVLGIMPSSGTLTGKPREEWEKSGVRVSTRDLPNDRSKIRQFHLPFSHVLDRDLYDAENDIRKIRVPIILIAGELDAEILPEDVKILYDNANEPKKYILVKDIGHNYRRNPFEIDTVNNEILKALSS